MSTAKPKDDDAREAKFPEHPLNAFLVHPSDAFEAGPTETQQITEDQWRVAERLLGDGYSLGVDANPVEAVALASAAGSRIKGDLAIGYQETDGWLWMKLRSVGNKSERRRASA